jgi:hypothetical protein
MLKYYIYYYNLDTKNSGKPNFNPRKSKSYIVFTNIKLAYIEIINKDKLKD